MKKIIALILCITVLFSLSACKKTDTLQSVDNEVGSALPNEKLKDTVEIDLPIAVLDEKYQNNLEQYCLDYGYISAKENKLKKTVTVTMNEFSYKLLLSQMGMMVIRAVYDVQESGDFPYVKEIVSLDTENFKTASISVDREEYKKDGDIAPFTIGQSCLLYQLYSQDNKYKCEVVVLDAKTNEVIETKTYTDKG